jgi:hypothetical protein
MLPNFLKVCRGKEVLEAGSGEIRTDGEMPHFSHKSVIICRFGTTTEMRQGRKYRFGF